MSFVQNRIEEQQLYLFDPLSTLTEREKKFLDRSWAKYFAEFIVCIMGLKPSPLGETFR